MNINAMERSGGIVIPGLKVSLFLKVRIFHDPGEL
jgi:hypothetical protein